MAAKRSNPHGFLGDRLQDLRSWLTAALEIYELRDTETVCKAKEEFLKWACEGWDGNSGDVDGALAFALESYVECGPSWADEPRTFHADFPLSAVPAWDLAEFHLLVAFALADHAFSAFKVGTKRQLALAAMLYADAIEAREHWRHIRGPAQARNKETRLGATLLCVEENLKQRELAQVRKATAREAAMAKLAKDPKQAAKAQALKLWQEWQSGRTLHRSGAAFHRHVCDQFPIITSAKTVERWCKEWREAKSRD